MSPSDPLLAEIETLLTAPSDRDDRARLERTLTDGYARVLNIEAERSRLQKRIDQLAVAGAPHEAVPGDELPGLRERLVACQDDLRRLRAPLVALRARYAAAARATPENA